MSRSSALTLLLAAASVALPVSAWAQARNDNATQRDSIQARRAARELRQTQKQVEEDRSRTSVSLGVARDRAEDGARSTTTPFALTQLLGNLDNPWKLQLKGAGYTRNSAPGAVTVDGLADVELALDHRLGGGFTGSVSLVLPTQGDVGSRAASQGLLLAYDRSLGRGWSLGLQASLSHQNGADPGVSAYTKQVYGELAYSLGEDHTVLANLARTWQGGLPSTTDVGVEYDFPIVAKTLSGVLALTRGITRGARHTTWEVGLVRSF